MLGEYVEQLPHPRLKIWTSWLKRSIETANHINGVQERFVTLAAFMGKNFLTEVHIFLKKFPLAAIGS